MEAFGLAPFGPLAPASSGHGNDSGRSISGLQNIFNKTGDISQVSLEAARNDLTHTQEFKWGDIFMRFNYQNKGGKLIANGRPIEDINDINEVGGDRMGRVMNALDQMVTDRNIAEAVVVSEDLGYGRHFIYRYRREEDENIEGLAFEYQGTKEELGQVVSQLRRRAINHSEDESRNSADFSKPLFFTEENKNGISDLSQAAFGSFNTEERRNEMSAYLTRLKRDTKGYEQLVHSRQQQEKALQNQYEKLILKDEDAKTGIASAVYGMLNTAEKMVVSESRRREESATPDTVTQIPKGYVRESEDIIRSLSYGLVAAPGLIDHTGRLIDQNDFIRTKSGSGDNTKGEKTKEADIQSEEQTIRQVIEPVVPAIIGLLPLMGIVSEDESVNDNPDKLSAINTENAGDYKEEEMIWQEFISPIFQPTDNKSGNIYTPAGKEEQTEILPGIAFFGQADEINEKQITPQTERMIVLKSGLQQGLENIAELISIDEFTGLDIGQMSKEQERQKAVEVDVVKLGEKITGIVMFSENKIQLPDSLVRLSFLINVYTDENSSEEVKHLLAVLIYKQIEKIYDDKEMTVLYPELAIISSKFTKLFKDTGFLEDKFNLLLLYLGETGADDISGKNGFEHEKVDIISRMIFSILQKQLIQITAEKLPKRNTFMTANINFAYPAKKRKQRKPSKQGIIYWFNKKVLYQYSSLLVTQSSL